MSKTECSTYSRPVLKGYGHEKGVVYLYQPRCKMWQCPYCAMLNKHTWCAKISEGIKHYQEKGITKWNFITVTSHEKNKSLEQCLYVWPDAWGKLSRRMRYHHPGMKYVLLPEQHRDGRLHIHAIASNGVKERFLKDHARKCGLGFMNESDPISNAKDSIYYVIKYLDKAIMDKKWPNRFRRVRTSIRWPILEDQGAFDRLPIEWEYLATYPAEGLDYLAKGIRQKTGFDTVILK